MFSELIIVLARGLTRGEVRSFETLRRVNEARPFKLVFLFEALDSNQEKVRWESASLLKSTTITGSLGFLDSPPTIRIARPVVYDLTTLN